MIQTIRKNGTVHTIKEDKDRFFFPDEYLKFLAELNSKQRLTTILLLNTGARINEIIHLKVEDVDLENKRLVLRKTKSKAKKDESKLWGKWLIRYLIYIFIFFAIVAFIRWMLR